VSFPLKTSYGFSKIAKNEIFGKNAKNENPETLYLSASPKIGFSDFPFLLVFRQTFLSSKGKKQYPQVFLGFSRNLTIPFSDFGSEHSP